MTNVLVLNFGFSLCVTFVLYWHEGYFEKLIKAKSNDQNWNEMNMILLLIVSMFQVQTPFISKLNDSALLCDFVM